MGLRERIRGTDEDNKALIGGGITLAVGILASLAFAKWGLKARIEAMETDDTLIFGGAVPLSLGLTGLGVRKMLVDRRELSSLGVGERRKMRERLGLSGVATVIGATMMTAGAVMYEGDTPEGHTTSSSSIPAVSVTETSPESLPADPSAFVITSEGVAPFAYNGGQPLRPGECIFPTPLNGASEGQKKDFQRRLNAAGLDAGPEDGRIIPGGQTSQAVDRGEIGIGMTPEQAAAIVFNEGDCHDFSLAYPSFADAWTVQG